MWWRGWGPGAFETIGGHVVNVALGVLSAGWPDTDAEMAGVDASTSSGRHPSRAAEKAKRLRGPRRGRDAGAG